MDMFGPAAPAAHQRRLRALLRWNDKVFTARVANEAVASLPASRKEDAAYLQWGLVIGGKPTELHVEVLDSEGERIGQLMVRRHLYENVNSPAEFRMDDDLERLYPFHPAHTVDLSKLGDYDWNAEARRVGL